jgi:homospermidine synthase
MNAITRVTHCWPVHARFDGPIVMIGFGSIGRGTLPLIERHIGFDRSKFVVIAPDDQNRDLLDGRQLRFINAAVTKENFRDLAPLLTGGPGRGMIINLSVDTSSVELMEFAKDIDAFYMDTVVEPWPGLYTDRTLSPSARSNYALREGILDLRRRRPGGITALSCCGANPGMVSWMVKQALLDLARSRHRAPRAALARSMGAADAAHGRQGHPHCGARYPARSLSQATRPVRQYLVGRGLCRRGPAALRAGLGHA